MHHKSWSNLRKCLEEDRLCPALRGRVQYFMTRYHDAHDDEGRLCIRVDGKEYLNSHSGNHYEWSSDGKFRRRTTEEHNQMGVFCYCHIISAIDTYMDELTSTKLWPLRSPSSACLLCLIVALANAVCPNLPL